MIILIWLLTHVCRVRAIFEQQLACEYLNHYSTLFSFFLAKKKNTSFPFINTECFITNALPSCSNASTSRRAYESTIYHAMSLLNIIHILQSNYLSSPLYEQINILLPWWKEVNFMSSTSFYFVGLKIIFALKSFRQKSNLLLKFFWD